MRRLNFKRDDGVAMTEFALILPIFMVIVAGLLGFGRVFFYWIEANHVANETARWAVVDRNPYAPTTLQQHARGQLRRPSSSNGAKVCIDFQRTGATLNLGDPFTCPVAKPFTSSRSSTSADHDPGLVDHAHRALRRRRTAPTTYAAGSPYEACQS